MPSEKFDHQVGPLWTSARLDVYLAKLLGERFSRTELKRAIDAGQFSLNGKPARGRDMVAEGDRIIGTLPESVSSELIPEKMDLKILHEDASLIVVDKPEGMVVHPGAGNKSGTLVHGLLGRNTPLAESDDPVRPGIVHRLDRETSGVLVVAKTSTAHRKLSAQFAERTLTKIYVALVKGRIEFDEGRYTEPIGRDPQRRIRMAVRRDELGKPAETRYRVAQRFHATTYLELQLLTGRTHQIRVHLMHAGHPILGDRIYAPPSVMHAARRLMLHAQSIEFVHPKSGKLVKFQSPLPADFQAVLEQQK